MGLALSIIALFGCSTTEPREGLPAEGTPARQALVERLEASIEQDRTRLAEIVTESRDIDTDPLHDDEELREIAGRLIEATKHLERLRAKPEAHP